MQPLNVHFENSELLAVPAVHFSHVFAAEVNRLCAHPETRPEAIAVELGPQTAAAVAERLRQLCLGPGGRNPLPVMLGLTRPNRMVRAGSRGKALALQRETGRDLSELPPRLLYNELGFAGASLLCLCPTDSLIEAVRCALELGLPLHGVDLEEMADGKYPAVAVQDPLSATGDLAGYVARNAAYAERQRDDEIDGRREIAMAARLKTLLRRHRRVLFTCGLAHWPRIQALLRDPSLRPALLSESAPAAENIFKKVVVHPLMAILYMDIFPALAVVYEKRRKAASDPRGATTAEPLPNAARVFSATLRNANRTYFREGRTKHWEHTRDLGSLAAFENYLRNLAVVHNRSVPDLFMVAAAAREIMSNEFMDAVVNGFMNIPWTSPEQHPDCTLLMPAPGHDGRPLAAVYGANGYLDKNHVFIRPVPNQGRPELHTDVPFSWADNRKPVKYYKFVEGLHTWAPWDNIITSLSLRAIVKAAKKGPRKTVEAFGGSLLEGIAVKATLRAFARGKENILVRDTSKLNAPSAPHNGDGFPVVWLLDPGAEDAEWMAMVEGFESMAPYVRNPGRFNHLRETKGDKLVATIGFGRQAVKGMGSPKGAKIRSDRYSGIALFQPLWATNRQFARWAELTNYERNPVCRDATLGSVFPSDLSKLFSKQHGVRLKEFHWTTTLILLAIPFARGLLPVAAPDGFRIAPAVFDKARAQGVEIAPVSLSSFTQPELERLSICQMVPALATEPTCVYPPWVETETGERPTDYLELVPRSWREFGM